MGTLLVLACLLTAVSLLKPPSGWKKCPKGDGDCLKEAITNAIKSMKNGNKGLGVIPLDPLHFEQLIIEQGGNGPVSINLTFYDVDLIGHSGLQLTSVKADWDNYEIEFDLSVDEPGMVLGDYTIAGRIMLLPIQGNGKCNITITGFRAKLILKGKELLKGGNKYFDVQTADYMIDADKAYVWFGNLFNGVPNLGDNMNKFLNQNWKAILEELKVTISLAMGEAFKQISNNIFHKVPLKDLIIS